MPQERTRRFHCVLQRRGSSPSDMAVGCNIDRRTQTETWEPTTTATEICLNPQLTETTITQNFVCCNERYPVASNDNSEGFQQPLSGKPSSIFIHHWRRCPVPRCTLVVCSHGYVPTCWGRPGSVEWIGVASPLFFCSLPPTSIQPCALKLVLWRHWMHVTQVHPVTSENQFYCTRLYKLGVLPVSMPVRFSVSCKQLTGHKKYSHWASDKN